jgi:hypothetical protein
MLLSLEVPEYLINHVLNGGGRQEFEYEWFYLREIDIE